jgi:iron complex outermembrane receptor protein
MQRTTLAALIAGLFALPVQADDIPSLEAIVVTATRMPMPDAAATYASEVHTRNMIEASGATTLYDYLARQTSVNVMPSYGNRDTPLLDMRGYGIGDGYQNIVVTLDGRRLNNIDGVPQLLGAIPLVDIDRIEITKGSGSVLFGDGATAGSIQIYTRPHAGASVEAGLGNHGGRDLTATAGLQKETVSLNASARYAGLDGYGDPDVTGQRDGSSNRTWRGSLELRPFDRLKFALDGSSSRIDTTYVGPFSLAEFNADPAQNGGNTYTRQLLNSDQWGVGLEAELSSAWKLTARHSREDKLSDFVTYSFDSRYDYRSDDLALQYRGGAFDLTAGVQAFDGTRSGTGDHTSKDNTAWYAQGQWRAGSTTFTAGARAEKVEYRYAPDSGAALNANHRLAAWDIGVNHRLDERLSLFANYDRAFQAPDIDRFFATDFSVSPPVTSFNGFITPAVSHTLNVGLNHVSRGNRLKLTVFRANLDNEIYYYSSGPWTGYNTNLDKTHKYGLELQDTWQATETLGASLNYAYSRAIIDRESQGGGAYDGKNLPGVPRHVVTLGLGWQAGPAAHLQVTHAWRGSAYAADDFANDFGQKQAAYQSTDLAFRYRHGDLEWSAGVDNLFEHKNGLWVQDDAIYPVSFTRNWRLGMKARF